MKTLTKFFAISAVVLTLGSSAAKAQTSMDSSKGARLGIGISGGVADKGSPFDYMLGADLRFQVDLMKYVSLTATAGYTTLMAKDNGPEYNFIPAKGGVKVFPIGSMYALGEIGAGFGLKDGEKASLIWSGGLGYAFDGGLDVSARYEGYSQNSSSTSYQPYNGQFALRLAYGFKL